MTQYQIEMEKRRTIRSRAAIVMLVVFAFAVLLEAFITYKVLRNNTYHSSEMLMNQVEAIIDNNNADEALQMEGLKENYLSAAKTAAYLLSQDPTCVNDMVKLQLIAQMLNVDELHVFDEDGTIIYGTNPEYYGLNVNDGEQILFFKPMLYDKNLTMCQDVTPNTAVSKSMMYAMTWNAEGTWMVQVGVEPVRLLEALEDHSISNILKDITLNEGIELYAVDKATKLVIAGTEDSAIGTPVSDMYNGIIDIEQIRFDRFFRYAGRNHYLNGRELDNYYLIYVYDTNYSKVYFTLPLGIITIYLSIAGLVILILFYQMQEYEEKKSFELQEQLEVITKQNSILKSMAGIYYSLHLIDLEKDTVIPYSAHGTVKEIVNRTDGAHEMMTEVIRATVIDEDREKALTFTDLSSVSARMENRKMISAEFRGVDIGWFDAAFISVEENDYGKPIRVIFATRSIDEEKKREESLVHTSKTDELTGLLNRRAYEDAIKRMENDGIPDNFVYVSLDVNGLKKVNDNIGHAAGDELLVGACACMKRALGSYGHIYRTGGDEFIALLQVDAREMMRLESDLEGEMDSWNGKYVDSLSIAMGYVTRKEAKASSLHEIAILADRKMYEAKARYYQIHGLDRRG